MGFQKSTHASNVRRQARPAVLLGRSSASRMSSCWYARSNLRCMHSTTATYTRYWSSCDMSKACCARAPAGRPSIWSARPRGAGRPAGRPSARPVTAWPRDRRARPAAHRPAPGRAAPAGRSRTPRPNSGQTCSHMRWCRRCGYPLARNGESRYIAIPDKTRRTQRWSRRRAVDAGGQSSRRGHHSAWSRQRRVPSRLRISRSGVIGELALRMARRGANLGDELTTIRLGG